MIRFDDSAITRMYSDASAYKGIPGELRHRIWWIAPSAVALIALVFRLESLFWCAALSMFVCMYIFLRPAMLNSDNKDRIRSYETALTQWRALCAQTDPTSPLPVSVSLLPHERVFYSGRSQRFAERHLGQRVETKQSGRVGAAIVGGIVAGPVGAIAGSAAAKTTIGTHSNIYGIAQLDDGELVITDRRLLFFGHRDTIEVPMDRIARFTLFQAAGPAGYRVIAEYPSRESGEQFSADPVLFPMNMNRRGGYSFPTPPPPAPLPTNIALQAAQSQPMSALK